MKKSVSKSSLFVFVLSIIVVVFSSFLLLRERFYSVRIINIENRIESALKHANNTRERRAILKDILMLLNGTDVFGPELQKELVSIRERLERLYQLDHVNYRELRLLFGDIRRVALIAIVRNHNFANILVLLLTIGIFLIFKVYIYQRRFLRSISSIGKLAEEIPVRMNLYIPDDMVEFSELEELVNSFNKLSDVNNMRLSLLDIAEKMEFSEEITAKVFEILREYTSVDSFTFMSVHNGRYIVRTSFNTYGGIGKDVGHSVELSLPIRNIIKKGDEMLLIDHFQDRIDEFSELSYARVLADEGIKSAVVFPIYSHKCIGLLVFGYLSDESVPRDDIKKLKSVVKVVNMLYRNSLLLETLMIATVTGFAKLVEKKDSETGEHLQRMALYSRLIAGRLVDNSKYPEVNPLFVERIFTYAPLHDIGKVGVPERILLKPGRLTSEEFEIMKEHTIIGYEILKDIDTQVEEAYGKPFFWMGERIARHHHERWDGSGYPDGLKGEEIPVCARIIAVADVFDALTSRRIYKKAFDYDTSVKIIVQGSGTQFDPDIVNAFISIQKEIRDVYERLKD